MSVKDVIKSSVYDALGGYEPICNDNFADYSDGRYGRDIHFSGL